MEISVQVSGHKPKITVKFKYDTSTQKASATWTCGGYYFKYTFFRFYVRMARKVSGEWKYTTTLLGGMSGPGGTDIWKPKNGEWKTVSKTVSKGSNTRVCFCIYCSAKKDGGSCDSGWGDGPTRVTDYYNLLTESRKPSIVMTAGTKWTDPVTGEEEDRVSKWMEGIRVTWTSSGDSAPTKLACSITRASDNVVVSAPYTPTAPLKLDGKTKTGTLTFSNLEKAGSWYKVKVAVATDDENLSTQWTDDYTNQNFRTRDRDPYVHFENAAASGTTATFTYRSVGNTNYACKLSTLKYQLTDKTAGTSTTGYIFKDVDDSEATNAMYTGTYSLSGLIAGHTYEVTPIAETCSLVNHVPMAAGYGTTFMGAIPPSITSITNSGNDLIFGEPDGKPSITVKLAGTANAWNITIKVGLSVANSVVTNPLVTVSGVVGDNVISLSDSVLDAIYKTMDIYSNTSICVSIEYSLSDGSNAGKQAKAATMKLLGNAKTSKVGVAGVTKRAKAWVGVAGLAKRAVFWAGVAGNSKRTL